MGGLLNKILITVGFLLLYRALAYVPVPGVDTDMLKSFFDDNSSNALGLVNMFSGNAIERMSIISLGIMPYITASIIMELLAITFPALGAMKKEQDGQTKYIQIIRYATVVITVIQSIGISLGLSALKGDNGSSAILLDLNTFIVLSIFSMLAGTMLLMWIGEKITKRGIGNGISLIIFAGIVSSIPSAISSTATLINTGSMSILTLLVILAIIFVTIFIIIYIELGERRIPITYAKKVMMQNQNKRIMNYIPVKVNLSGVIPVIFASAILMFPLTILQGTTNPALVDIADFLNPNGYTFNIITFLLVLFFSYFYSSVAFNAKDISNNIKKQSGFIPGIRPGKSTEDFLLGVASRLTLTGSLYLGLVATLPWVILKSMGVSFFFGGTAVLIVVQVALDTMRKVQAQVYMNKYNTLSVVGL